MSKASVIQRICDYTAKILNREYPDETEKSYTISHGWTVNIESTRITQDDLDEGFGNGLQVGDVIQLAYYVRDAKGIERDQVEVATPFEKHYRQDVEYLVGMYWGRRSI